jgi:hypothetical protein
MPAERVIFVMGKLTPSSLSIFDDVLGVQPAVYSAALEYSRSYFHAPSH